MNIRFNNNKITRQGQRGNEETTDSKEIHTEKAGSGRLRSHWWRVLLCNQEIQHIWLARPGSLVGEQSQVQVVVLMKEKAESESFYTHWSIIHKLSNLDQRKSFSFLWDSPAEGFATLMGLRHWGCWHDHTHLNNTDFLRNSPTLHTSLSFVFALSRRCILTCTSRKGEVPENTEEERAEKS